MSTDATYAYHPTFGGMVFEVESELTTAFCFGISTGPTVIPDPNSPKGSFYRKLVPLSDQEAAERLIERLAEKAADMASAAPLMRASLIRGLEHVRREPISELPGVRIAVQAAINAAALAALAEPIPGNSGSAYGIREDVAALAARVAVLEARIQGVVP